MTAHELAKQLLAGPDIPVVINGWGSDEGFVHEVQMVCDPGPDEYYEGRGLSTYKKGEVIGLSY